MRERADLFAGRDVCSTEGIETFPGRQNGESSFKKAQIRNIGDSQPMGGGYLQSGVLAARGRRKWGPLKMKFHRQTGSVVPCFTPERRD